MKPLLVALALVSSFAMANEEKPSVDFVKDSYEFCADYSKAEPDAEQATLACVNEEIAAGGYATFSSLAELKDYIKQP